MSKHTFDVGYLYVFYHPTFQQYGENVYKLGKTNDLQARKQNAYTTGFLTDGNYLYTSTQFKDYHRAERVLFYLLRRERCRKNREFFQVDLQRVIDIIHHLEQLEASCPMYKLYAILCYNMLPYNVLRKLQNAEDATEYFGRIDDTKAFLKSLDSLDDWFEQFRFRPSNPTLYQSLGLTFLHPEVQDIQMLLGKAGMEEEDLVDEITSLQV